MCLTEKRCVHTKPVSALCVCFQFLNFRICIILRFRKQTQALRADKSVLRTSSRVMFGTDSLQIRPPGKDQSALSRKFY